MIKRTRSRISLLALALLLLALLAPVARAENGCVVVSCKPAAQVAVLTTATTVCALPTFNASLYAGAGAYTYLVIAVLTYTEPSTATTITTSNGVAASGVLTGVNSGGIQAIAISSSTWTPNGASTYPDSIGTMTATGGTTGGTAETTSRYTFITCPAYHS